MAGRGFTHYCNHPNKRELTDEEVKAQEYMLKGFRSWFAQYSKSLGYNSTEDASNAVYEKLANQIREITS